VTNKTAWVVTTSGERPVADIASDLTKHGFHTEHVLSAVNVITGQCAPSKINALRKISGVSAIEPDGEINIGPPDSPTTW
jgi:hypothetical protein